ncbi:MAG: UDP-2,3-diacylglucosamine diphosphatase [Methanobacterium sp.]|uniref:UDP-2,3-diacylglucosamine diphosphatase n=1 Tax=Methanobacterium sp. TaxID=2164 RepID=UPI003C708683
MILVLSDVHLGYARCNKNTFINFLDTYEKENIDHLILLGDFFDFWRRNNAEIITDNDEVIQKIIDLEAKNLHYIIGNHDYYMYKLGELYGENFPFTISKNLRLEDGGNKFYFTHGYEFEAIYLEPVTLEMYEDFSERMCFSEDLIGELAGHVWSLIRGSDLKDKLSNNPRTRLASTEELNRIYKLSVSKGKSFILGMKTDEILVFGHTHGPFINKDKTVVNTGSWVNELIKEEYQNSYVEIEDGIIELKFFKDKS